MANTENYQEKEEVLNQKIQTVIDGLLSLGIIAVGLPQILELKANCNGEYDIPMNIRIAV